MMICFAHAGIVGLSIIIRFLEAVKEYQIDHQRECPPLKAVIKEK
jgi:hypothetical protein